ncbi:hypothetical protein DP57_6128 [Burkholderia pseudomallei]|nr:hypothetical protein DP57_6128 [Burkholderia pseudomallei]
MQLLATPGSRTLRFPSRTGYVHVDRSECQKLMAVLVRRLWWQLSRSRSHPTGMRSCRSELRRLRRLHPLVPENGRRRNALAVTSSRKRVPPPVAVHASASQPGAFPDKLHRSPRLLRCPQRTTLWTSRAADGSCDLEKSRPSVRCRGFVENATLPEQPRRLRSLRAVRFRSRRYRSANRHRPALSVAAPALSISRPESHRGVHF